MKNKTVRISLLLILLIICAAAIAAGVVMLTDTDKKTVDGTGAVTDADTGNGTVPGREDPPVIDPSSYTALVADSITAGSGTHGISLSEGVTSRRMNASTGTVSKDYDVWYFAGKGASAAWTMDLSAPGDDENVILEIEEIHEASLQSFGYTVFVDGKETFFRTYEMISSSPNHYFIAVKKTDIADPKNVSVKIVSADDKPFAIAGVWGYTGFFSGLADAGVSSSLRFYLHSADSVEKAEGHIKDFEGYSYDNFDLGLMFKVGYMTTDEEAFTTVQDALNTAAKHDLPLQLMPSLSWSAPYDVPDGKGGSFADVKYGQVLYNSLTGEWVDSTPNAYGNTQWCSWGEKTLLNAQITRISDLWEKVTAQINLLRSSGEYDRDISTLIEHSVVYKGPLPQQKFYTMGAIDGGDFNPAVIAAAKADGITLDPTDGLSYEEKKWMNEYQARYVQTLADVYNKAYGTEAILVRGEEIVYPETAASNNIFSHTVQWIDQTPSHGDLRISGWKSGIGTGFYEASEEFVLIDDIRFYQYRVAYGKTGCCNFEMSSLYDPDTFKASVGKLYEAGVNFITLFNDSTEYKTAAMLKELDKKLPSSAAAEVPHYDISLLNVDYNRDAAANDALLSGEYGVADFSGVRFDPSNGVLKPENGQSEGYVLYHVTDNGVPFANGICFDLEAQGSIKPGIRVYAGESPENMEELGVFRYDRGQSNSFDKHSKQRFDVTGTTKGLSGYYIKLVFEAGTGCDVKALAVYRPFDTVTGQKNGITYTKEQVRLMNLFVSGRAEAERTLDRLTAKNGGTGSETDAIRSLIDMGLFGESVKLANLAMERILPITFAVTGGGQLGTLPVTAKLNSSTTSATVTVKSLSDTGASFTVSSVYSLNAHKREVKLTFTGLKEGNYKLVTTGWNEFEITAASAEEAVKPNEDGSYTFTAAAGYDKTPAYTTVTGRVYYIGNGKIEITVQDPAISGYKRYVSVLLGTKCQYTRYQDGDPDHATADKPVKGDFVTVTFADDGETPLTVTAVYGKKTGTIRSFTPPDMTDADTTNGLIELTDGTVYELEYQAYSTSVSFGGEKAYYARAMTTEDMLGVFRPGREITITYCPEVYGKYQRLLTITG